jgi:hypothetical protein
MGLRRLTSLPYVTRLDAVKVDVAVRFLRMRPVVTARKKRPASLEKVLAYENPRILRGFNRDYSLGRAETRLLFREMLKLLWLAGATRGPVSIWPRWKLLDAMWHTFILHTKDYEAFCHRYFGKMIHHDPGTHGGRKPSRRQLTRELETSVDRVWNGLGEETARLWFVDIWRRHTPRFVNRHTRRATDKG